MKKSGFTLAEVLITLSIIGVVSALTVPNLGANTSISKNRAALQNTMATLNNVLLQNEARYGWNLSDVSDSCAASAAGVVSEHAKDKYSRCALFNTQLVGETYLGTVAGNVVANSNKASKYGFKESSATYLQAALGASGLTISSVYAYRLANGAVFGFNGNVGACLEGDKKINCVGFIDVNGNAGPNTPIKCENGNPKSYFAYGASYTSDSSCSLKENTNADIFPIYFNNNYIIPGTDAVHRYLAE